MRICGPCRRRCRPCVRAVVDRIGENCEPSLCTVMFMAGAGGSLRAGVTENPVLLTRSVQSGQTTCHHGRCAGLPVARRRHHGDGGRARGCRRTPSAMCRRRPSSRLSSSRCRARYISPPAGTRKKLFLSSDVVKTYRGASARGAVARRQSLAAGVRQGLRMLRQDSPGRHAARQSPASARRPHRSRHLG